MIKNKFCLAALFSAIALLLLSTSASADLGPNVLVNPSFEDGTTVPTGWAGSTGNKNTVKFAFPVAGMDGSKAARIDVTKYTNGDVFWMPTAAPVTSGSKYEFKALSKSNVTSTVIATYLKGTKVSSYETLGTVVGNGAAQTFTKTITIPAGVTNVKIQHVIRAVGYLEIDGYFLGLSSNTSPATTTPPAVPPVVPPATTTPPIVPPPATTTPPAAPPATPPASNLIANGDLEKAGSNASLPQNWNKDKWGNHTATFTYPVTGKSGKAAKTVVTNYKTGDAKWWFNHIPASSHTIYKFSDDYISDVATTLTLELKMSDGSYRYEWLLTAPASSSWNHAEMEITVPVGAVSFTVLHSLNSNGSLTIDNASVTALPANPFPTGMVTLSFDDGLSSQFTNARPILNDAGMKAGYYIITDSVGDSSYMTWANISTLLSEGNEIGGHTMTHPDLTSISSALATMEVKGSFMDLASHGFSPQTFVYPYGGVNPAVEKKVKDAGYKGARASFWGLNSKTADKYALYDIRVDSTTSVADIKKWIDQAVADKRWLILELHDVLPSIVGEYDTTTAIFKGIVDYIKQSGIKTVTMSEGLDLMNQ